MKNSTPVPKYDLELFRKTVQERVIKPMQARRIRQARLVEKVRKRVII